MNQEKIGNFIVLLRKEKKLTQIQLAEKLDVSDKTISKWERGICLPEPVTIDKIINFFDISLMEFYAGERNEKLSSKIVNNTVKEALNFSIKEKNKKFKKTTFKIILLFIFLLLSITTIYMFNTYNKFRVYTISSSNNNFSGTGNIILAKKKNILTLIDVIINDENLAKKSGFVYEYYLSINDTLLCHNGDIYSDKHSNNLININDFLKNLTLYLNYNSNEVNKNINLKNHKLTLKILFIDGNLKEDEITMNFDISVPIANNRIIF